MFSSEEYACAVQRYCLPGIDKLVPLSKLSEVALRLRSIEAELLPAPRRHPPFCSPIPDFEVDHFLNEHGLYVIYQARAYRFANTLPTEGLIQMDNIMDPFALEHDRLS